MEGTLFKYTFLLIMQYFHHTSILTPWNVLWLCTDMLHQLLCDICVLLSQHYVSSYVHVVLQLQKLARRLKKEKVTIDIVNFGEDVISIILWNYSIDDNLVAL